MQDGVDLIEVANQIHGIESCETYALIINSDSSALLGKFDVVIQVQDEAIKNYDQRAIADVVAGLHREHGFDSILVPGSQRGRMLAPRVAMQVGTGLVADVTEIRRCDQKVQFVRPAYGGRMMACIEITGNGPVMLTVRPNIFSYEGPASKQTKVIKPQGLRYRSGGIRQIRQEEKVVEYDIRESDVLISGGGGVSNNFAALESLAQALQGKVSSSRAVVDQGLAPRSVQVGQSGKTVRPRLYIAVGIHGAIQHVVGINDADYIISVNTNPKAPICSLSDIVVEGDAVTFIDKLLQHIGEKEK